jgi:hypothetical protein
MSSAVQRSLLQSNRPTIARPLNLLARAMLGTGGWRLVAIATLIAMLPLMEAAGAVLLLASLSGIIRG